MKTKDKVDCMELVSSLSPDELEAFIDINEKITGLTSYGIRTELVEKPSTFMVWSNASKGWFAAHPKSGWGEKVKTGEEIRLDANHLIVPYPYKLVDKLTPCLKDLPLYGCSFEAKQRGEVDPVSSSLCWAVKQLERIKKEEWQKENK